MRLSIGVLASLPALVASLASTDSYRDADLPQSGYLPNHNIDPNLAGSSSFRNLWTFTSPNPREFWLAKPLVYTPEGSPELVITASEMNIIRVFDSKTGNVLQQRTLQPPFSAGDSNCGDIPDWIGVTGTPIIDPATDIMYVFSKGYRDGTTSGTANGVYKMYALRIPSLEDVSGFPVLIDGMNADNDKARYFVGGVALQRPSLADVGGHIVAAFGSHCGRWNYTGYLLSVSKTPGVGPVSMWATEAAPGAPSPQPLDLALERGGKAGIWQSGMGLPVVGNNVYFVTGNGQGHANGNVPASGRVPMSTLDECVVRMDITGGKLSLVDYFQPYDYIALDAGDRDVGASGLAILDPTVFKGTGVNRMCVTAGKKGRAYVMNADNLGGFRQATDGGDGVLQTIELGFSLYGGFGSYPAEGGYIYATTVGGPLVAYKLGFDARGAPQFTLAGRSDFISAGRVGVGQMTITSDNGRPGTGIVWVTDVNTGLRAFRAVPQDGVMVPITLPSTQGVNKFQRPVFGNGRVFFNVNNNRLVAMGSPVNSAVNCTSPVEFGSVEAGTSKSLTVSCKANVGLSQISGCSVADPTWKCANSTLPQGAVAAGTSFSLNVTWDLSDPTVRVVPGFLSSALTLSVSPPAEYASTVVVSLQGTVVKQGAFLSATPSDIAFGRLVLRDSPDGLTGSALLQNIGNGTLTFTGFAWQTNTSDYANFTSNGDLGSGFSSTNFPAVGSTLEAGASLTVALRFMRQTPGSYISKITIWSNGGTGLLTLSASVNEPPTVTFELADGSGGWNPLSDYKVSFGNVPAGGLVDKQIRVCNRGGAPLTITISKPPATPQLFALNPNHELTEGTQVTAGSCAIGSVGIHAAPVQPNHPSQPLRALWTLSTDGLDPVTGEASGLHNIVFNGTVVAKQVGPLLSNGTARYQWVGCFQDTTNLGRNLQVSVNNAAQQRTNTLQQCQGLCLDRGYILSGVQYHQECWCGGNIRNPSTYRDESLNLCTFDCTGDDTQACGGDYGHMSLYADATQFDIPAFYRSLNAPSSSSSVAVSTASSTRVSSSSVATSSSSSSVVVSSSSASSVSSSSVISSSASTSTVVFSTAVSTTVASSTAGSSSSAILSSSSGVPSSSVAPTTSTSTTSSSTSSSATPSSTIIMSPLNPRMPAIIGGQWQYAGCFKDLVDNARLFTGASSASDDMSLDKCAAFCSTGAPGGGAFNYFGVEYGRECYCGWDAQAAKMATAEAECYAPCAGSPIGLCGAGFRLSVYNNTIPSKPPSGPENAARAGDYELLGCQTEGVNGRALTGNFYGSDDMTSKTCAAFCAKGSWLFMGVEYSRECWCGNSVNAGSIPAPLKECDMRCQGNQSEFCGGNNRLGLYQLSPLSGVSSSAVTSPTSTVLSSSTPSSSLASTIASTTSVVSSASSSTSASTSTSSSAVLSSPVSTTSLVPSVPASTTKATTTLTPVNSATSRASATATDGYYYVGCYRDRNAGHALPLLFANRSVTPELCIDYANSVHAKAPTPTAKLPYLFLEYHHECYGGSSFDFQGAAVTTLVGTRACKNYCYGSVSTFTTDGTVTTTTGTANYCGGAKMFDLYALSTPVEFPTTGGPLVTQTA
ncbi:WSC domain-containing protein-like protein 3 [Colletotrichum plurivorum]|uniref:WSC domain-containing protein-like protein 3 n=1 Tax=Colletotrichum plurivorum TaxID=2175906 RepID=A0A8H6K038_9PEZI|nr:WSC domain-containing protein-like protein 3 [Colletotrichum plurivorum]